MSVIKLGNLTTFTGDPSGSYLVMNNAANTLTYKIQRETLLSYPIAITGSTIYSVSPAAGPDFNTANSIFLGTGSGYLANYSNNSNFLGSQSGYQAYSASYSNFFGNLAGFVASNANNSNFFGYLTAFGATNAYQSNFFGNQSGYEATHANNSNFLGYLSGYQSYSASRSNFLGEQAGYKASGSNSSNFFGYFAGYQAQSASYSLLIGYKAGNASNPSLSIGTNNIIIGTNISLEKDRRDSVNIGAIIFATGSYSTVLGNTFTGSVGNGRVGINKSNPQYSLDVSGSGNYTNGLNVTGSLSVTGSIILNNASLEPVLAVSGTSIYSVNPSTSGFSSNNGIFIGSSAGNNSAGTDGAIFIGSSAGENSTNALGSIFLGGTAGAYASNPQLSNFIGGGAGTYAIDASGSNFIGISAGDSAANAAYSNFIGYFAGSANGTPNSVGRNNIIIGTNITLEQGRKDSINIGGLIFATGSYFNLATISSGSANGRVGINEPNPTQALQVSGSVQISQTLVLPPQNPLPSGQPTGSIAVSGSGVDCKPYFWNGSTWTALLA